MSSTVSEQQAHDVVDAAPESEWTLPSFGKQLFLGDFRLLARLPAFLETEVEPLEIERSRTATC